MSTQGQQSSKPPEIRYESRVPIVEDADVLVVGGGPAGIGAAIGAARAGARTVLVEQYGFLGGAGTAALVGPFMTSFSADGTTQIVGGVFDELIRRMEAISGAIHPERVRAGSAESGFYEYGHDHVTPFDPEALKLTAAEMAIESGVILYLHTRFVAPLLAEGRAGGAIVHNKSGLSAIRAGVVVDCSADADFASLAGVPTTKGRSEDGLMQPMTMFFRVGNVDDDAVHSYLKAHPEERGQLFAGFVEEARAKGEFPIPRDRIGIYRSPQPGIWRVNTTRLHGLDGTQVQDLTRAEIEGRRQVALLMRFFHEYLPGFKRAILLDTAAQIGVRETRRIVGEYLLTVEDLIQGTDFPDVIALGSYPVDIHSPTGLGGGVLASLQMGYQTAPIYQIPYRCLIPNVVDQLLVAGRCLSATHEAAAAVRVQPTAYASGHAAGVAAALSVQREETPRHLPATLTQQALLQQGAILPPRTKKA